MVIGIFATISTKREVDCENHTTENRQYCDNKGRMYAANVIEIRYSYQGKDRVIGNFKRSRNKETYRKAMRIAYIRGYTSITVENKDFQRGGGNICAQR